MVLALGAFLLSLPLQDPDRSGEPALRELFQAMGSVRSVHIAISRSRIEGGNTLPEDAVIWLDYAEPGVFRLLNNGSFGDGELWTSDGKRIMRDPLDGPTVETGKAAASFLAPGNPLQLSRGMPLVCALLDGEAGMNGLVSKNAAVTAVVAGGRTRFEFGVAGGGSAVVEARKDGSKWAVLATEFVNAQQPGGGAFRGRQGALRDTVVAWKSPARGGKGAFVVTVPPGTTEVPFSDRRGFGG